MSDYDEGYDEGYSAGREELHKRIAELERQVTVGKEDRSHLYWKAKELEAERDRLRDALQKIIKEPYPVPKNDIAKQALEEIDK